MTSATEKLSNAIICPHVAELGQRLLRLMGEINNCANALWVMGDSLRPEYRSDINRKEMVRVGHQIDVARAAIARALAGPEAYKAEVSAAMEALEHCEPSLAEAIQAAILGSAYATESLGNTPADFHTDGNGAVLCAIGVRP